MNNEILILENDHSVNIVIRSAIDDATQVIEQYNSKNSKRAFEGDLAYWRAWYKANELSSNEKIRKEHIILFIMQHAQEMPRHVHDNLVRSKFRSNLCTMHKISTIRRRIASLSRFLNLNKLENPCYDKDIVILLTKLTEKFGCSESWGKAITVDVLNDLLSTCEDNIFGIRDAALLLFGFSTGGRRRSEIASAMLENLTRNSNGSYIYKMGKSKTNQTGKEDLKPVVGRAALALRKWLEVSNLPGGHIFRGINNRKGFIMPSGLSDKQISRIIKSRCEKAGYDPSEYTAHSLRSGFVTESGKRGKPIGDVMAMTGHRNVTQVMKYYQSGDILNNSTAYLAG